MEDLSNYLSKISDEHSEHKSHLPTLIGIQKKLYEQCRVLDISNCKNLKYVILKKQCDYLLQSIAEMNQGIILCLENGLYSSVESLSRIAIEHAVNLIYIVEGEEHQRAKSLLKHYVIDTKKRAERWLVYSTKHGDEKAVEKAELKLEYLKEVSDLNPSLVKKNVKGWPDARARFRETGLESLYHVLFSSASDSVHSLSEDIFNLTIIENFPDSSKDSGLIGFISEKTSFAFYLATNSLGLFSEAAARLASRMEDKLVLNKIIEVAPEINLLVAEHESLMDGYHENLTSAGKGRS